MIHRFTILIIILLHSMALAAGQNQLADESELYEGKEFQKAFANPKDNPDLPNVLLIGDSISIGYTVAVRKKLHGKADVFRIKGNGKNSAHGADKIDTWLKGRKYDLIHFNWGLWDICYRHPESKNQGHRDKINGSLTESPEQYERNLRLILKKLKNTQAKLIWCNTTPVPKGELGRIQGDEIKYNQIAASVMKEHKIPVNDLHSHALLKLPSIQKAPGDVHFTPDGYSYLAQKVAEEITEALKP